MNKPTRNRTTGLLVLAVMLGFGGLAYGVGQASAVLGHDATTTHTANRTASRTTPDATPVAAPQTRAPQPAPLKVRPELIPGKRLMGSGDHGAQVRELQARLKQIAWYTGLVDDDYGSATEAAVRGFQAKRKIAVTGYVDARTLARLHAMTRKPTDDELHNKLPSMNGNAPGKADPRCLTGRVLCIDKSTRTLRWMNDGKVLQTLDVRFGSTINNTPTREGLFHVGWKSRDHVSKLYDSSMPFAMFFSGGQAVHYSSDFAARGYAGASHGCVNVRDYNGIKSLFDQVQVGDKVVVYWS